MTEIVFKDIFCKYGNVVDIIIKTYNFTKEDDRQAGYGFVYFDSIHSAMLAMNSLKNNTIGNISLDCNLPTKKSEQQNAANAQHIAQPTFLSHGGQYNDNRIPLPGMANNHNFNRKNQHAHNSYPSHQHRGQPHNNHRPSYDDLMLSTPANSQHVGIANDYGRERTGFLGAISNSTQSMLRGMHSMTSVLPRGLAPSASHSSTGPIPNQQRHHIPHPGFNHLQQQQQQLAFAAAQQAQELRQNKGLLGSRPEEDFGLSKLSFLSDKSRLANDSTFGDIFSLSTNLLDISPLSNGNNSGNSIFFPSPISEDKEGAAKETSFPKSIFEFSS
jgi:hypothetical protein